MDFSMCDATRYTLYLLLCFAASASSQDYSLTMGPRDLNVRLNRNSVLFRCENLQGVLQNNAVLFLNESVVPSSQVARLENGDLSLSITRDVEGGYSCRSGLLLSNVIQVVALPDLSDFLQSRAFPAYFGSTARLDCPILPGATGSQYYVTWVNASDPSIIFAEIFPPNRRNARFSASLNERYSINPETFSLNIDAVRVTDGDVSYRCIPGVEDYSFQLEYLYDVETDSVQQSLFVNRGPEIVLSSDQVVSSVDTLSATFQCRTLSSPYESTLSWMHGDIAVPAEGDSKRTVSTTHGDNPDDSEGGVVTISTLTILNPDGFDSGVIQCVANTGYYTGTEDEDIRRNLSETTLSVLGNRTEIVVIRSVNNDITLRINLNQRIPVPVSIHIRFTDPSSGFSYTTMPSISYSNMSVINYVLFGSEIRYDRFQVEVALVNGRNTGPFSGDSDIYDKTLQPDKTQVSLIIALAILGVICIIIVMVLLCLCCKCLNSQKINNQLEKENMKLNDTYALCEIKEKELHADKDKLNADKDKLHADKDKLNADKDKLHAVKDKANADLIATLKDYIEFKNTPTTLSESKDKKDRADEDIIEKQDNILIANYCIQLINIARRNGVPENKINYHEIEHS